MAAARARHNTLTKPPGSLGRLEDLGIWLAGVQGRPQPHIEDIAIIVAAADHGVAARGVSAYPQAVTGQMLRNYLSGGAAVSVLAAQAGAVVVVVDAGVVKAPEPTTQLLSRRGGAGTKDFTKGRAMSKTQAKKQVEEGIRLTQHLSEMGVDVIGVGEMGIANSTAAAAITAAVTGLPPASVTGRGTGIDETTRRHKIDIVEQALAANQPNPNDPYSLLTVGGFEIAFLAGAMLGAASQRMAIVLDGFITAAAAFIARGFCPGVVDYMVASHRSQEPGHEAALLALGLRPLLDWSMRLGEGSAAALVAPLLRSAAAVLSDMATFEEAGVSEAAS